MSEYTYLPRLMDTQLQETLSYIGAVLIVGPKWCGKTTTAEMQAKSVLKMQDPDQSKGYLATAETKPSLLLMGENPRLLDEWQIAPVLWDAVRTAVDNRHETGLFILTGSNSVDEKQIMHSGTGRIAKLQMYPMSLYESKESNGSISLRALFDDPDLDIDGVKSDLTVEQLIFAACRGGWPASLNAKSEKGALFIAKTYLQSVCDEDCSNIDGVRRDPQRMRTILRSYARNISTLATNASILSDIQANFSDLSEPTLYAYLNVLKRLFVIEDVPAWNPSIRSATSMRSGDKKEFTDPSIAVAALNLSPEKLLLDLHTFGFIFETLCIRDLKVYSASLGGRVSYYHDRFDLEADCVLHLDNGKYALIEFKLGSKQIEEGARHLCGIRDLIRKHNTEKPEQKLSEPDLLIVITGGEIAYRREDGVCVIPIGCLKD